MFEVPDTRAEAPQSAAAKLFDLRVLIGGLFIVYGVMLTVAGFFTSARDVAKASGININFWMGIGMLSRTGRGSCLPGFWIGMDGLRRAGLGGGRRLPAD